MLLGSIGYLFVIPYGKGAGGKITALFVMREIGAVCFIL